MMPSWISLFAVALAVLQSTPSVPAAVSPQVFVGTWVGTQAWNISAPPPGTDQQQPVTLTIDYIDGKLVGTLTPFMGGDDGAVFVDTRIVGDELHATATFGRPSQPGTAASTASKAPADEDEDQPRIVPKTRARRTSWKDTVKIQFVLKADRLDLKGTGDVTMNDVKWLKFKYDLSKKRSRY